MNSQSVKKITVTELYFLAAEIKIISIGYSNVKYNNISK